MKNLKPSLRERKRYLLIEGKNANKEDIEKTILEFIGVLGWAEASPKFIKNEKNKLIVAINHFALDKIRTSFLMSEKDIKIKKVSGTVNKVE